MKKRIFAIVLLLCLVLPLLLACNSGEKQGEVTTEAPVTTESPEPAVDAEPNTVIFTSADFQGRNTTGGSSASGTTSDPTYNDGNAVASEILKRIIQNIKNDGYTKVDATIFCGDYDIDNGNNASDSKAGIDSIKAVYAEMDWNTTASGSDTTHIFVQGNHEAKAAIGTCGLSGANRDASGALGAFDTEHYGLYLLHEDYHPFKTTGYTDEMIDNAAAELKEYLDAKLAENYQKPIFIAAHVPLHYNVWMHSGLYAKPFFDVINEAAGKGLNIIYLFGHDHGGYDEYLGGTDIYMPVGSVIVVPDRGTKATKQQYALNFTYMTAGLSAYVAGDHSENKLSGTVFEIYDDRVVIKRYSDSTDRANNGIINVGNVGEDRPANSAAGLVHSYYPKEYTSPQVLTFDKQTEITDSATNVSVRAFGVSSLKVSIGEPVVDGDIRKITYDVRPELSNGKAYNDYGIVTLPLPEAVFENAAASELSVTSGGRPCAVLSCENGMLRIWTSRFSEFEVSYAPSVLVTCKRVTAADLKDGKKYLLVAGQVQSISSAYNKYIVSPETFVLSSPQRVGLAMIGAGIGSGAVPQSITVDSKYVFTLTKDASGNWVFGSDGQYLFAGGTSGNWASSGDNAYRVRQLKYSKNGTPFKIESYGNGGMVSILTPVENGKYPCYMYVTSYGNTCLMDKPEGFTPPSSGDTNISFYYMYEVQD